MITRNKILECDAVIWLVSILAAPFLGFMIGNYTSSVAYMDLINENYLACTRPIVLHGTTTPAVAEIRPKIIEQGVSSWYDYDLEGIEWSKEHNTAASRTLTRYAHYKITNLDNGNSVVVFINDFGPEEQTGRILDLSSHAFGQLAPLHLGLINIKIEEL